MTKVVIIGAGISGLSAGIYAQMNGFKSEIYEQNAIAGGHCSYWKRKDYTFNGSISYLSGVKENEVLHKVWQEVGAFNKKDIYFQDVLVTVESKGVTLKWYRDFDKLKIHLTEISRIDKERIEELIDSMEGMATFKIPAKKSMDMMNPIDWINQIIEMGGALKISNKYRKMTVEEYANTFNSELIKSALLSFAPKDFQATAILSVISNLINDYSGKIYGGSEKLVTNLVKRYEDLGGNIYYHKSVNKILIDGNKAKGIRLNNGKTVESDYVISACDPHVTFIKLLPEDYMNKDYKKILANIDDVAPHSIVQVYFGIKENMSKYPSSYIKETTPYEDVNGEVVKEIAVEHFCKDHLITGQIEKSVLKIAVPTKSYDQWKKMSKSEYETTKKEIEILYTKKLIEVFPEIKGKIEVVNVTTPVTMEKYCSSFQGAYMGLELSPRLKKQYLTNKVKKVKNIFLANQWTMLSGGLPVACLSGKFAVQRICKQQKNEFIGVH